VTRPHLVLVTNMPGRNDLTNLQFDPTCNYAGCGICGKVFQSDLDREPNPLPSQQAEALFKRTTWRIKHAGTHSEAQHRQLQESGLFALPEATEKLAAFGIIPLTDTVKHEEVNSALLAASRAPTDDAEGT
jgi:hypothetical protein